MIVEKCRLFRVIPKKLFRRFSRSWKNRFCDRIWKVVFFKFFNAQYTTKTRLSEPK